MDGSLNAERGAGRRFTLLPTIALLATLLSWATVASATDVFHSPNDDGLPAVGAPTVPEGGVQSIYVYIEGGGTASSAFTACDTGTGGEVCGYTLTLTGLTGLTLVGFTPEPTANLLSDTTSSVFRVNGLDTAAPTPGPKRIGEIQVNAVAGGTLELTSGEVIGADLSSEALVSGEIVAVPEPGVALQLLAGAVLLGALKSGRAHS